MSGAPTFELIGLDIALRGVLPAAMLAQGYQGWLIALDRTGALVWEATECQGGGKPHDQFPMSHHVVCLGVDSNHWPTLKEVTPSNVVVSEYKPTVCSDYYGSITHDATIDMYDHAHPVYAFEVRWRGGGAARWCGAVVARGEGMARRCGAVVRRGRAARGGEGMVRW